ncbi:MAG: rhodanese-like domain-containing protein [Pirellulaceae bacterium]|nr:rhodanese-like domain-containing protein [Pirellulaceae bacterium]
MTGDPLEISVTEVQSLFDAGDDFLLVDCREPLETDYASIDGGRPMPMSQLVERAGELEPHRAVRIVCYCHHGVRSLQVVHWLRQQGFARAQSMAGGIDVWSQQVDAAMPRYELGFEGLSPLEAAKDDPV